MTQDHVFLLCVPPTKFGAGVAVDWVMNLSIVAAGQVLSQGFHAVLEVLIVRLILAFPQWWNDGEARTKGTGDSSEGGRSWVDRGQSIADFLSAEMIQPWASVLLCIWPRLSLLGYRTPVFVVINGL